ncbi:M67 family metallopeptidase [Paenibacillus sp. WLX1005]|uniref:M67 family metallopeptidase n=1 Tax=Paenibacillus sp. WLX1005 TaxID=3243766 RepID=UPI0039845581
MESLSRERVIRLADTPHCQQKSILSISSDAYNAMIQHMTSFPDMEVCGILLGTKTAGSTQIHSYRRLRNVAHDPLHHFTLDPQEWIDCCYRERELIGLFHSHPMTAAIPSSTDLQQLPAFAAMISIYAIGSLVASSNRSDNQDHPDINTTPINVYQINQSVNPSSYPLPIYNLQTAQLNIMTE